MAKKCAACGRELGMFNGKIQVNDKEYICSNCWLEAGLNTGDLLDKISMYSSKDIINMINENKNHDLTIMDFVVTSDICPSAKFNDDTKQMILADHAFVYVSSNAQKKRPQNYTLFSYEQIVGFELLENGESIASGGVGRAALGGILFGGVGAIVGASTRSYKSVCQELKIKVTVKDFKSPAFYIPLIITETSKSSSVYKDYMKMAQDILSKLQLITSMNPTPTESKVSSSEDKFEEIRKYKTLFDEGIISEEEFENKKKELLNL